MRSRAYPSRNAGLPNITALLAAMAVLAGLLLPGVHAHTAHRSFASPAHAAGSDAKHADSCGHSGESPADAPPTHDHSSCDICKLILTGAAGTLFLQPLARIALHTFVVEASPPDSQSAAITRYLAGLPARGPPAA